MHRKKFLQLSTLGISSVIPSFSPGGIKPIIVSTWDSGQGVNEAAWKILRTNGRALDAVETGALYIENLVSCCVGLGGYPDRDGIVSLDACIMDEHANCGAVAGIERIKHPVSVARKVMENTPHVLLVGHGAQKFALENGFNLQPATLSPKAEKAYKEWLKDSEYRPQINIENMPVSEEGKKKGPVAPNFFNDGTANHDTMGLVALDSRGNFSGAVTTSGMAFKMHGRVGDSPVIGAGLFVDNEIGAAVSSGVGEEVIRICGTHLVVEYMRQGYSPELSCKKAVERIIKRDRKKAATLQVGFVALNKQGQHGGYAVQDGFVYSVKSERETKMYKSKYFLPKNVK